MSWNLIFHVLRKAYWNMFGELFLDEIAADGSDHCTDCTNNPVVYNTYDVLRCSSRAGRYVVPVMLGVYVLIVNILMLNLLIAKFSSTIQRIEKNSRVEWSYQRSLMLREFSRGILPFPFTLFNVLLYVVSRGHYADSDPFFYREGSNTTIKKLSAQKQAAQEKEAVAKQTDKTKSGDVAVIVNMLENKVLPMLNKLNNFYEDHVCCCQKEHDQTELEDALRRLENRKRDQLELRMDQTYRRKVDSASLESNSKVTDRLDRIEYALRRLETQKKDELELPMDQTHRGKMGTKSSVNDRLARMEDVLRRLENRKRDELELRMNETYRRKVAHSQSWDSSPAAPGTSRSFIGAARGRGSRAQFHVTPK